MIGLSTGWKSACLVMGGSVLSATFSKADDAADIEFFEKEIRPVLVESCYKCHSADSE